MTNTHVVVVNDDPVQLAQVSAVLKGAGHRVSAYLDGESALSTLSERSEVHLFVVDLHMPGIDGWKLCRLLRSPDFGQHNQTPILVVSATFTGSDVEAITSELGANAFLEAPFEAEVLLDRVAALLAGEAPRADQLALIVDDDEAIRATLRRAFASQGFLVAEATTLAEARTAWVSRRPDVVLLDYHLPDGASEDLLHELRDPLNRTSVLVMTGDADPALPVRLLAGGADGYLRKPFAPSFAVELAAKAARQRALLRVETILEARTQELRASEIRYRGLFETIPDLVVILDNRGHVAEINPDGLGFLAAVEADVVDRHILEIVHPKRTRELGRWLAALQGPDGAGSLETELSDTAGDPVAVELSGRQVEWHGCPALLLVGRDLTERRKAEAERRRLEAQMQHAQRLESLGVLAGGVAHDFNNLLVGILGNASLVLMDLPEDSPLCESIHQIETAAHRAAELTQQILAFAGKSKVTTTGIHLPELVREMGQLVEPAISKKARMFYDLPGGLPKFRGDAGQMRQVVMNLIINASDALGSGSGDIRVSATLVQLQANHTFVAVDGGRPEPGPWIRFEVSDNGAGMDQDTMSRIFEPFFSTKFAGRGLGLASTLGIVRSHHGFIKVDSRPGAGTTMTVLLPPQGTGLSEGAGGGAPGAVTLKGPGTVMVVDDEPQVRRLARMVLVRQGFTVIEAENGAEALSMASATPLDAVVTDMSMPEMDGLECARRLRERFPDLPILLSSGYPPEGVADGKEADPLTAFLKKPYRPTDLLEGLQAVVNTAGGLAGARA